MDALATTIKQKQDAMEEITSRLPQVELPLHHLFIDGLCVRSISMPAGTIVCTRTHKKRHPFFLLAGKIEVISEKGDHEMIQAPHVGITEPGARRTIIIHEDAIWSGVIATDITDPDEFVKEFSTSDESLHPEGFTEPAFTKARLSLV